MKKNNKMRNMRFFGFFGLMGLLGIVLDNPGFFGFFGFFSFFVASSRQDERLELNTYKAGFNAFVVALIGLSFLATSLAINLGINAVSLIIAGTFIATLLTFVISFMVYEKR